MINKIFLDIQSIVFNNRANEICPSFYFYFFIYHGNAYSIFSCFIPYNS